MNRLNLPHGNTSCKPTNARDYFLGAQSITSRVAGGEVCGLWPCSSDDRRQNVRCARPVIKLRVAHTLQPIILETAVRIHEYHLVIRLNQTAKHSANVLLKIHGTTVLCKPQQIQTSCKVMLMLLKPLRASLSLKGHI